MKILLISMSIGLFTGFIDILPMIMQKLNKRAIVSAFLQYFFVSIVIVNCDLPDIVWWLQGGIISFCLALPVIIIVSENDKKAVPIIVAMSLVLGTMVSIARHFFI